MSNSERPADSGHAPRRNSNSGGGSSSGGSGNGSVAGGNRGGSSLAALFRNVLRSSFQNEESREPTPAVPDPPTVNMDQATAIISTASTDSPSEHRYDHSDPKHTQEEAKGGSTVSDKQPIGSDTYNLQTAESEYADDTASLDEKQQSEQMAESIAETMSIDAELLVLRFSHLSDRDATLDSRLSALDGLVLEVKDKRLINVIAIWSAIDDIVRLAFEGVNDEGEPQQLDTDRRLTARRLVLTLLVELAEDGLSDSSIGGNASQIRRNMLNVASMAEGWSEISLAARYASWASDSAHHFEEDPRVWFERAKNWVEVAVQHCYSEETPLEPLHGPPADAQAALTASLEFLSQIVTTEYPVLDPDQVSVLISTLCTQAAKTRLVNEGNIQEVTWVWTESAHLYGVLHLLKTVITYGALSKKMLSPGIALLCTTSDIEMCRSLCCEIVYTLFTSCYMRDTLLAMNSILRKGNKLMNAMLIYGNSTMTPYQIAVNGIVFYITQVMDTGPTDFQFSLRIGNCLPVLGKAVECMHADVLRLVFPYLCKVASDSRIDSMMADDWEVLISIMATTIECRTSDKFDGSAGSESGDSAAGNEDGEGDAEPNDHGNAPLPYLYDTALRSIVGVVRRRKDLPLIHLTQLLYQLREVLSDDLAQDLLCLVDSNGSLRVGESSRIQTLESLMHIYYFDRSRSLALRRQMIGLCAKIFAESVDVDLAGFVQTPIIMSLLEQLSLEDDVEIVESVLGVLNVTLKRIKDTHTFSAVLAFAARASVEPTYTRLMQTLQQPSSGSGQGAGDISPGQHSFQINTPGYSPPVLVDSVSDSVERPYPSFQRITLTVRCLLDVLEWRISNTDVGSGLIYVHSAPDTIELTECLMDLLESPHTFSLVQRDIMSVFLRLHADSSLKLYILKPDSDTVMDQRVSLHENARLRINTINRSRSDSSVTDSDNRTIASTVSTLQKTPFPIERYVRILIYLFQTNTDIETYYVLCRGLSTQLGNTYLFSTCERQMYSLIIYLTGFVRVATYGHEPRVRLSAMDKNQASTLTFGLLIGAMHYKDLLRREHQDALIIAFSEGLIMTSGTMSAKSTPQICLNALSVGMLELPGATMRNLPGILQQLTRIFTATMLSVHLLEFVSSVSREHRLYANFHTKDYLTLFAVAIDYIGFHNRQRRQEANIPSSGSGTQISADPRRLGSASAGVGEDIHGSLARSTLRDVALNQYVLAMAYQVIDVYYLSLPPATKAEIVDYLIIGLLQSNFSRSGLDEANVVCLDMIIQNYGRTSEEIMNLDETYFAEDLGPVIERGWIQHNAIVTIRAQTQGPLAQIAVRSVSGTRSRVVNLPAEMQRKYAERLELPVISPPVSPMAESPSSSLGHSASKAQSRGRSINRSRRLQSLAMAGQQGMPTEGVTLPADSVKRLLRNELIQGVVTKSRTAHLPISFGPAPCLAQEFISAYPELQNIDPPEPLSLESEPVARSIRVLDNITTIDTHKVSVAYVGPGQTTEQEIMLNQQGSLAYWNFLRGLGNITRLSGMKGFSGGLDTSGQDEDGQYTIRWRDLIAQLVFHVGTLMPAGKEKHEKYIRKKAHMGNDYVQIVFNESGKEYEFDTIPSEFNYVQIIVTPVDGSIPNRDEDASWLNNEPDHGETQFVQLYKVKTQVNPNVPFYGPAMEPKLLTLTALPGFVRSIAIHAAILSQVFSSCKKVDSSAAEYVSPWRHRLRAIQRARLHAQRQTAKPLPVTAGSTSYTSSRAMSSASVGALSDFGTIVEDPTDAVTASQALGYLIKDLNTFYGR
ncbi:Tuberous sclerosis 2-like protein [Coemansia interrupta]|uniref:Tuberous sclerosis 2-like protein n=1 Tax=Coemansia interrupta TaxID=1126814 RepID=A0A9W8HLP2_9FUNG|nr:Tuberous sclerosis 2-like protein [Coemansia interrupta]